MSTQEEKSLPADKADKLAEKISEKVYKTYKEAKEDLTKHEVSPGQAKEIVYDGFARGVEKIGKEEGDSSLRTKLFPKK